ncbi:MAG: undecaprenyldiphospho-muramoylpentapeptide beta-N-acetylglucosaminyltransferase [Candidatus Cloacimonetes bacterium]|nr:undecaprenyldiphospho-muramoylpentapeptide beta-N-acetylglucosaminyltransferase [Candidatus Cloacimonadota bacterium]
MKTILISGGGTAGHINPALSIAGYLKKQGWEIHFIGNRASLEERLVIAAGYQFHVINIQKLYRKVTFAHCKFPFKLINSIIKSSLLIKKIKPDFFLGTGGFVSGPAGFAAHLHGIPVFLQEQNSFPGITTKILAKWAKMIFLGNSQAVKYLPENKTSYTGNPINPGFFQKPQPVDMQKLGLSSTTKKIFLVGGSQGSLLLNNTLSPIVDKLLEMGLELIWQTGSYSYTRFQQQFGSRKGIYLFSYTDNIAALYEMSELVIARAGAITLAELEYLRKPAILIPLASAAENHQFYNATELAEKGEAEVIEEKNLTPALLHKILITMLGNIEKYKARFGDTLHQHSAENIAAVINKFYREMV